MQKLKRCLKTGLNITSPVNKPSKHYPLLYFIKVTAKKQHLVNDRIAPILPVM